MLSQEYSFFHIQGHCLIIPDSFGSKHRPVHFYEYLFWCLTVELFAVGSNYDFCSWTCFVPQSPSRKYEATAWQQKGKEDSRNLCIRAILTHLLPGLDVLLDSQLLIPIKFCHGRFWQTWRITMFFTHSEMFRKARCLVVNFLLLVNMHIACPVSDSNDIWSIFRGNHRLDQTFSLSWNSSSILPSLKHPGFPCLNCNSVLLICSSRALPHTFRDAPNSTQPTSAFHYQSCISMRGITQTIQLLVSSGQKRKQYDGISTHPRFLDKEMVWEKGTCSPTQLARRDM